MPRITREQKISLYRDGFLILRNIIPREHVEQARKILNERVGRLRSTAVASKKIDEVRQVARSTYRPGDNEVFLDLFNGTPLKGAVEQLFGDPVPPATGLQIAVNYPSRPSDEVDESGYCDRDTPFYGWNGHLDGLWNGGAAPPPVGDKLTKSQLQKWNRDPSTNGCARCNPTFNANITNFTALVGVALSDQRREGVGNLGLLKGAHHRMEQFFQRQAAAGGPLGPDGPFWPRENKQAPNEHGLNHYPSEVRRAYRRGAVTLEDGSVWPKPTLMKLAPGDAVIAHFAVPHSATRVEGPDPRMMIYFRATAAMRPLTNQAVYPAALTDIWREWNGMRAVVREQRKTAQK